MNYLMIDYNDALNNRMIVDSNCEEIFQNVENPLSYAYVLIHSDNTALRVIDSADIQKLCDNDASKLVSILRKEYARHMLLGGPDGKQYVQKD